MDEIGDFGPYKFPTPFLPVEFLSSSSLYLFSSYVTYLGIFNRTRIINIIYTFWGFPPYHFSDIYFLLHCLDRIYQAVALLTLPCLLAFNP